MRRIFSPENCLKHWYERKLPEGRDNSGDHGFADGLLWGLTETRVQRGWRRNWASRQTNIAKWYDLPSGTVMLVSCEGYGDYDKAWRKVVPWSWGEDKGYKTIGARHVDDPAMNVGWLRNKILNAAGYIMSNGRTAGEGTMSHLEHAVVDAEKFVETFDLPAKFTSKLSGFELATIGVMGEMDEAALHLPMDHRNMSMRDIRVNLKSAKVTDMSRAGDWILLKHAGDVAAALSTGLFDHAELTAPLRPWQTLLNQRNESVALAVAYLLTDPDTSVALRLKFTTGLQPPNLVERVKDLGASPVLLGYDWWGFPNEDDAMVAMMTGEFEQQSLVAPGLAA